MPKSIAGQWKIEKWEILDKDGNLDAALMPKDLTDNEIKEMYRLMVEARQFDEKALKLQRSGRLGTLASLHGQEAAQVGSAYALDEIDWMVPSYREHAAYLARGVPLYMLFQYWMGDERGNKTNAKDKNFTVSIPVGSQPLHAVGIGWAANIKKEKTAAIVYFGDGATSEGDTLEAMNFAGVFNTPTIFLCQNNQFAISLPRARQTHAETIAQKAIAFGIEGLQVDGNDVFAVYAATRYAVEKAHAGKGPTLIEAITYRMSDHTTADDASKYRKPEEVEFWKARDPIDRLRKFMMKKGIWNEADEKKLQEQSTKDVEDAVVKADSVPKPPVDDMFMYLYAEMPKNLASQLEYLKQTSAEMEGQG